MLLVYFFNFPLSVSPIKSADENMGDDILEFQEGDKPTLLQRKTIGDRILVKIMGFVETFVMRL